MTEEVTARLQTVQQASPLIMIISDRRGLESFVH